MILDSPEGALDRETNKSLLLRHIEDLAATGTTLGELQQVLPSLSRDQVQTLLRELKRTERIEIMGTTKAARWFLAGSKRNSDAIQVVSACRSKISIACVLG